MGGDLRRWQENPESLVGINQNLLIPPAQLSTLLSTPSARGLGESPAFSFPRGVLRFGAKAGAVGGEGE